MVVQPSLLDHPRYLVLRRELGPAALEILVRLWSHCQEDQRGDLWPKADWMYVEAIIRWSGEPKSAFERLVAAGWVTETKRGIRISSWSEHNKSLVNSWRNGRFGGRKKKPTGNPRVTHGQPVANPTAAHGASDKSRVEEGETRTHTRASIGAPETAEAPSLDEFLAFCAAFRGELASGTPGPIDPEWAQKNWEWWSNSRNAGFETLKDWRRAVVARWRENCRTRSAPPAGPAKPASPVAAAIGDRQRLAHLQELMAVHPGNPENAVGSLERKERERPEFEKLRREREELRRRVVGVGGGDE